MPEAVRPSEVRLKDPLSEVTRQERKTLLGVCAIVITIARTGLIPSKISALGVDFDQADQRALLRILLLVVLYFAAAFLIYASSDLVAWQVSFHNAVRDWARRRAAMKPEEQEAEERVMRDFNRRGRLWWNLSPFVSFARALFEFVVPLAVAVYAVVILQGASVPRLEEPAKLPVLKTPSSPAPATARPALATTPSAAAGRSRGRAA